MKVFYTSKFKREYKKLPRVIKNCFKEKSVIFREDIFDLKLDTHKLHGKFSDFWSFSVDHKYRVVFDFSKDKKIVYFHSIGNHDVYR